jgi:hypothetical protein
MPFRPTRVAVLACALTAASLQAADVSVSDSPSLRRACAAANPGDHIRLAPGRYAPGVYLSNLNGTPDHPITIEGDANDPPVFDGGTEALHLSNCSHVVLRNLRVTGQSGNGINVDDGGRIDAPTHHITLENLAVENVGPSGNHDAIKISGLDDFVIRDCRITGWAGQAIDMVGCHRGLIENCTFTGKEGFSQATGPQFKGGTSDVTLRRCTFVNAGDRALNVGGSTGAAYFRPSTAAIEARAITVEGCTFHGSVTPVAFVGVDGAVFRYNTIVYPKKWLFRILQENRTPGFPPCRNVHFDHNLVVWNDADCPVPVNIGDATAPQTFTFSDNFWYCADAPAKSRLQLPAKESRGIYGRDPRISRDTGVPRDPAATPYGAHALPKPTNQ